MSMHKLFGTIAVVSAMAIASPAVAQYSSQTQSGPYRGYGNADANLSGRIQRLQVRLQAGIRSGAITRREAAPLRQQIWQLGQLERQFAQDGRVTGQERAELQRRLRDLRQGVRIADGGNQARWDTYDREDGYGRDGYGVNDDYGRGDDRRNYGDRSDDRYDDRYDDRDDDRGYGRDGAAWNDGRYGGTMEQPARNGLGGVVDALLGRGGLQVGQRVPDGLYGLPSDYRDTYRDSSRYYYRTDGRQIYEVDARSHAIARIYTMNR